MATVGKPTKKDFQFVGGNLALDFVNTVGNRLSERRDYFQNGADVVRWARLAGLIAKASDLTIAPAHLQALVTTREYLYVLFRKLESGHTLSDHDLGQLNHLLAEVLTRRKLTVRSGHIGWEWNGSRSDLSQILGPVLSSAAELVVSGAAGNLRQCEDPECGWLFVDCSQAHRRRWCSMADCGNRAKARRFYDARRDTDRR